jgi:hypothetical protein
VLPGAVTCCYVLREYGESRRKSIETARLVAPLVAPIRGYSQATPSPSRSRLVSFARLDRRLAA